MKPLKMAVDMDLCEAALKDALKQYREEFFTNAEAVLFHPNNAFVAGVLSTIFKGLKWYAVPFESEYWFVVVGPYQKSILSKGA